VGQRWHQRALFHEVGPPFPAVGHQAVQKTLRAARASDAWGLARGFEKQPSGGFSIGWGSRSTSQCNIINWAELSRLDSANPSH
jgi:hypothetical protein